MRNWRPFSSATATRRTSWKAATPTACTRRWRPPWSTACWRSASSRRGAADRQGLPAALADDRPAEPQGLDRAPRGGRPLPGGFLAGAPDPPDRRRRQPGPPEIAGIVDAQLQAGGAFRRTGAAGPRTEGAGAQREPAHERQPRGQRRAAAPASGHARLPRVRRRRRRSRVGPLPGMSPRWATSSGKSCG